MSRDKGQREHNNNHAIMTTTTTTGGNARSGGAAATANPFPPIPVLFFSLLPPSSFLYSLVPSSFSKSADKFSSRNPLGRGGRARRISAPVRRASPACTPAHGAAHTAPPRAARAALPPTFIAASRGRGEVSPHWRVFFLSEILDRVPGSRTRVQVASAWHHNSESWRAAAG